MPMQSEAQRKFLWANHPDIAREFEAATPKGAKLPKRLHPKKSSTMKKAFIEGASSAFIQFGLKTAGEEMRLKIPNREFHGWNQAWNNASGAAPSTAPEGIPMDAEMPPETDEAPPEEMTPIDKFTAAIQAMEDPAGAQRPDAPRDPLDRNVAWGAPSHLDAGDTANRGSSMGQQTGSGSVY